MKIHFHKELECSKINIQFHKKLECSNQSQETTLSSPVNSPSGKGRRLDIGNNILSTKNQSPQELHWESIYMRKSVESL